MDNYIENLTLFGNIDDNENLDDAQKFDFVNQTMMAYESVNLLTQSQAYIEEYVEELGVDKASDLEADLEDAILAVQPITFQVTGLANRAGDLAEALLGDESTEEMASESQVIMDILRDFQATLQVELGKLNAVVDALGDLDEEADQLSDSLELLVTYLVNVFLLAGIQLLEPIEDADDHEGHAHA
ncbi:hypothetical protein KAR50_05655 [Periweissella fabaria]|uniref:Uncharacterized protein n=1 Tax=Periweissella fabaria TaxID=546157 RepID=A0ABN8BJ93_9LACO|nr:hypothetical protein [Periweissella fabaria]MCM0597327.1 hypothetical protein [Periweissella fabaria]CAH0416169.1 hypothetical protein WFA24289_00468 [Periweissella fabaria]